MAANSANKTTYTWVVDNFSTLSSALQKTFSWNGYTFYIDFYPKGYTNGNGASNNRYSILSIYQNASMNLNKYGCKIAILDTNSQEWMTAVGQIITKKYNTFVNYSGVEMRIFETNINEAKSSVLPNDKLTIQVEVFNLADNCNCPLLTPGQASNSDKLNLKCSDCGSKDNPLYDPKPVLDDLSSLLEATTLEDVVCEVGGKEFKLHKAILAARSPVFKAMFTKNLEESRLNRFKVPDISVESFEEALRYLYSGKIPKLEESALELFEFADKYDIKPLKSICEKYLGSNVNIATVVGALIIADLHNAAELKAKCLDFIAANGNAVSGDKSFEQLESRPKLLMEVCKRLTSK